MSFSEVNVHFRARGDRGNPNNNLDSQQAIGAFLPMHMRQAYRSPWDLAGRPTADEASPILQQVACGGCHLLTPGWRTACVHCGKAL